jgi:hypothetical protein
VGNDPAVPVTVAAGILAPAAVYHRGKSLLIALPVGLAITVFTAIATFAVSCSRWCK